jgi:hypothetical protein
MVPVLALAVIAVVVIKTLMSVVAREETTELAPWNPAHSVYEPISYDALTYDPTVRLSAELRPTANDDVRGFLLPAVSEADDADIEVPR